MCMGGGRGDLRGGGCFRVGGNRALEGPVTLSIGGEQRLLPFTD